MKQIVLILLVLFSSLLAVAQSQGNRIMSGKVVHTQTGSDSTTFTVSCNFTDEGGLFDGTSVAEGDYLFVSDGGYGFYLPVDTVLTPGPVTVIVKVSKVGISLGAIPVGIGYISRGTSYMEAFPFVSGVSSADQQISMENTLHMVDSILQYRLPTRTIGGVPPAYTPTSKDSWIAQNGDGLIYYWDGDSWELPQNGVYTSGPVTGSGVQFFPVTLLNNSITAAYIATNGVATAEILDGTVAKIDLAANSVDSTKISQGGVSMGDLNQSAATSGQVIKWNGNMWIPSTDNSGSISDGDKGDIDVTSSGATWTVDTFAITPIKIDSNAVTMSKIDQAGATINQVLKWNGVDWAPANDIGGGMGDDWGVQTVNITGTSTLSGNGTVATPLKVATNGITSTELAANSVDSTKITNRSISVFDIGQNSASNGQVLKWNGNMWIPSADAGGVSDGDKGDIDVTSTGTVWTIDTNAVTTIKLANDAIDSTKLTANSVQSSDIKDGQVWRVDLADNIIDSIKLAVSSVQSSDIADGQIWKNDLSANSVDSTKISQRGVSMRDIAPEGASTGQVLKYTGNMWAPGTDNTTVADGDYGDITITGGVYTIDNGVVTNVKLANDAVDSVKLAPNAVQSSDINNGQVWRVDIANDAIDSTKLSPNSVQSSDITNGQVWRVDIANDAIDSTKIATNAIQSTDIANGQIWLQDMAANSVDSTKIKNGGISVFDIGQNGATSNQILKWNGNMWLPSVDATGSTPALANTNIFVGNASNVATAVAVSGNATISNTGVLNVNSAQQYFAITDSYTEGAGVDQNNWSLNGSRMLISPSANINITGINTGTNAGRLLYLTNINSFNVTLKEDNASSSAVNRFKNGTDYVLTPNKTAALIHNGTFWRVVGHEIHTGDVTGIYSATVVERLRGKNLPAPVAGDDEKFIKYDHDTNAFVYAVGGGGADNWGSQVVEKDGTLTGTGVLGNLLGVATNAIDSTRLATNSVQSTDIANGQVWLQDLASNSVDSTKILTGHVMSSDIANGQVWTVDLADNAVTNIKVADNAIGNAEIADNAVGTNEIINGGVALIDQADMATNSLVYRKTGGVGPPEINTLATLKTDLGLAGNNNGDVTLAGETYITIAGQAITAGAVNLSGTQATGTLAAARMPALTGEATTTVGTVAVTLTNSAVIGKVLTGYVSAPGTVAATDNILQAIQKLDGNDATNANLTGPITSVGNTTSVASQTGTGSTFVMSASPTFTGTPTLPTGTIGVTQVDGTNNTTLATTAFVTSANAVNANLTGMVTSVGNATTVVTNANLTGDVTSAGNATTIADNSVDGTDIALGSDATGDIMYYDGTDWVRRPVGTNSHVLTLTGGVPVWAAPGSGADNWGTQVVERGTTLTGTGVIGNVLDVATNGITSTQMADNAIGTAEVTDNTLSASDLAVNVVSSVDGVTNDGGNVDFIAGGIVTITPDDAANTVTISVPAETDGSIVNEIQSLTITGAASPFTLDISISANDVNFAEGTGITLSESPANTLVISSSVTDTRANIEEANVVVVTNPTATDFGAGFDVAVDATEGDISLDLAEITEQVQDNSWNVLGGTQTGITVSYNDVGNDVSFVVTDALVTNEGSLTVVAGGANNSEIQSNTSGSTNVVIAGGTGFTVTESGSTITGAVNLSTGIATGQSVIGGTAASESLTISSTANATKGDILFGTSAYKEATNRLGVNTTSPTATVHLLQPTIASVGAGSGTNSINALTLLGATGGATSAGSGTVTGGSGGGVLIDGGTGGAITGVPATGFGGKGGNITETGGTGGAGTTFGGNGGDAILAGGVGGTGTTPGAGGYVSLKGGNAAPVGNSSGGNVFLVGGIKNGSGIDGDIYLGVSPSFTTRGAVKIGGASAPGALLTLGESGTKLGNLSLAGNTSGTVTLQPAAAAGTYTLTLPTDDGSADQILKTDGSGVLSWTAPPSSGFLGTNFTAGGGSGNIPATTTATQLGDFTIDQSDLYLFRLGDVNNSSGGYGFKVDGSGQSISMGGDIYGSSSYYIIANTGGNYIRTPASNLQQQITGTTWDILSGATDGFKFTDNRVTKKGIEYSSDISASLLANNRSIVDVGTVKALYTAGSGITLTPSGNNVVVAATDASATNELQNIASTNDATSHTVTLSDLGGSIQLVEGTNITLTTTGTPDDAIVTIASTGSADGNGVYSGNGTVPSLTKATITNQLTFYRATDDNGGLMPVRIEVAAGNEPEFLSMVNGVDSLWFSKGDTELQIKANEVLSLSTTETFNILADSILFQGVANSFSNEATFLQMSPGGAVVKVEGVDPDVINANGATNGQVLKYNTATSNWEPGADNSGGLGDADYGDITVSGSGTVMNIDAGVVSNLEISDVSASKLTSGTIGATLNITNNVSGEVNIKYNDGSIGLKVSDLTSVATLQSPDGTQGLYADDVAVSLTSGSGLMQFQDEVIKLYETDQSNFVGIKAPTLAADYTLILPTDDGTANQVLSTNGTGTLTWVNQGAGTNVATDVIWDVKGDLAVGTGANTAARLAVGSDGTQIYADAATATGLRWGPSVITPTQLTSDQDNYAPTGWAKAQIVNVSGDAEIRAITSFSATFDGDIKTLFNVGSNTIYIPTEHPDGTAANRVSGYSDFYLCAKRSVQIMYNSTSSRWFILSDNYLLQENTSYFRQYLPGSITAGDISVYAWTVLGTGATVSSAQATANVTGATSLATGTSSTGYVYFRGKSIDEPYSLGDMAIMESAMVSFPTLSDGTDTYNFLFSVESAPTSASLMNNNSFCIRYKHDVNAGKWEGVSKNSAGSETTVDLGVTVAADTQYKLEIHVDKALTECRFYVNGAYVGRITTGLPTSGTTCGPRFMMSKSVGGSIRIANIHGLFEAGFVK